MIFWQLLLVVFVLGIFQHFVFQVTSQNVVCVGNYVPVRRPCSLQVPASSQPCGAAGQARAAALR